MYKVRHGGHSNPLETEVVGPVTQGNLLLLSEVEVNISYRKP